MTRNEIIKLIKYVIGSVGAVLMAAAVSLDYAYAAGIIALLTIQDTKRETIKIALKRIVIFFVMTILAAAIFPLAGFHVWAFGIALIPYLTCCMVLKMNEAITPIAVLCTHYISSGSCAFSVIGNEFFILIIGVGIGIFLNLFMPDGRAKIIEYQQNINEKMAFLIRQLARDMDKKETGHDSGIYFDELNQILECLKKETLNYMNNHFFCENCESYYQFVQTRTVQYNVLKQIYKDIHRLTATQKQTRALAKTLETISEKFVQESQIQMLISELEKLKQHYTKQELPKSREEFENRAILYHILEDIQVFLKVQV